MVEFGDMTEAQVAAMTAIVNGKLAWSELSVLESQGHGEAIRELIGMELAVMWGRPHVGHLNKDRVTLAPYGAWLMRTHILERSVAEDPYWDELDKEPPPLHLPQRRHEVRCPWMEEFADPNAEDPNHDEEYLVDEVSGKEIELFTQLFDGREVEGIKIKIDRRLKGKGKGKGKGGAKQARRRAG